MVSFSRNVGLLWFLALLADGPAAQGADAAADALTIPQLVAALESDDYVAVHQAVMVLVQRQDRAAVEPLCAFLNDQRKNGVDRSIAPDVLQKLGDERAVPALLQALKDSNHFVRASAERALVALHWKPATVTERAYCAMAREQWDEAAKLGAPAVEPLLAALKTTDDAQLRLAAAGALGKLAWQPANDAERAWLLVARRDWEEAAKLGAVAVEPLVTVFADFTTKDFDLGQVARRTLLDMGPVAMEPLLTLLQSKRVGFSPAAATMLGELNDPRAVEPLLAVLKDRSYPPAVPPRVIDALGRLGDSRAFEPLVAMLKDSSPENRQRAACALLELGDRRAVEPLTAALKDDDPSVREAAGLALAALGQQPSADALAKQLQDPSAEVRASALQALAQMGDHRALEPLLAALKDPDLKVRRQAADALGRLGDTAATKPLIAALQDAENGVRWSAAAALGRLGDPGAVAPLITALKEPDVWVRGSVAEALGQLGDPQAVEPLRAALKRPDGTVITAVAMGLAALVRDESAVAPLLAALEEPDSEWTGLEVFGSLMAIGPAAVKPLAAAVEHPSVKVRGAVVEFLTRFGDENGVQPLIKALADPNGDVARAAAYGLAELDDPQAVAPLAAALKDRGSALWREGNPYPPAQADRIAGLADGAPAELAPLIAALEDSRWHLRYAAVWVLGRQGDNRAIATLAAVLKAAERSRQRDEQTRGMFLCGQALARLRSPLAMRPLVTAIKQYDPDEMDGPQGAPAMTACFRRIQERQTAKLLDALTALGPAAADPLLPLLEDAKPSVRILAAKGLGRVGRQPALDALTALQTDPDPRVRDAATEAIRAIQSRNP